MDQSDAEGDIRSYYARRGQQVQSIQPVLFSWKRLFGRGVSSLAKSYRVTTKSNDGDVRTYEVAFDPAGAAAIRNSGLKRYANGAWFDAN